MPITFPDFENGHFFWLMACGEVLSASEDLVKWMKGERDKIAPIKTSRGTGYVKLMLGGHSGNHVHFDIISPELASKRLKSESKSTLPDVQASADRLRGKEVEVNLKGGFQANLQELPESGIVRSLLFRPRLERSRSNWMERYSP